MVYCFTHGQAVAPRSASSSDLAVGQLEAKMERKYMTIWWSNTKLAQLCIPYLNNNDDLKIWCFVLVVPTSWRKKKMTHRLMAIFCTDAFYTLRNHLAVVFVSKIFSGENVGPSEYSETAISIRLLILTFFHNYYWSQSFLTNHLLPSVMLISQCSFGNPIQASSSPLRSLRWPT